MIFEEEFNPRLEALQELGRLFYIGSNKLELYGMLQVMKFQSELVGSLPVSNEIYLASSIEITQVNKEPLIYVWLILNGLTDTLPEPKWTRKQLLITMEWLNYFNVYQTSKTYEKVYWSMIEKIKKTKNITADEEEKVLLERGYQRELKALYSGKSKIFDSSFEAYQKLLGITSTEEEKLLILARGPNYGKMIDILAHEKMPEDVRTKWIDKVRTELIENRSSVYDKIWEVGQFNRFFLQRYRSNKNIFPI